jgi:hypothetical protein
VLDAGGRGRFSGSLPRRNQSNYNRGPQSILPISNDAPVADVCGLRPIGCIRTTRSAGGAEPFGIRVETTDGTYAIAEAIRADDESQGFYQTGPSFRRKTSDCATAAKLQFNAFVQLRLQLIHSADTKADIVTPVRAG